MASQQRAQRGTAAPLDRCLALAVCLPLPPRTTARNRDILWAVCSRRATGRSMREIGDEYDLTASGVRGVVVAVMARMGIQGVAYGDPAYWEPYAEGKSGRVSFTYRGSRAGPFDGWAGFGRAVTADSGGVRHEILRWR